MNQFRKAALIGALSISMISPSYAISDQAKKDVIYGLGALVAWGGVGAFNSVLRAYVKVDDNAAQWGFSIGAACGSLAAGLSKPWNPATDPVNTRNVIMSSIKSIVVISTSVSCGWASAAVANKLTTNYDVAKTNSTVAHNSVGTRNQIAAADLTFDSAMNAMAVSMNKTRKAYQDYKLFKDKLDNMNCKNFSQQSLCQTVLNSSLKNLGIFNAQLKATDQKAWDLGQAAYAEDKWLKLQLPKPTAPRP